MVHETNLHNKAHEDYTNIVQKRTVVALCKHILYSVKVSFVVFSFDSQ